MQTPINPRWQTATVTIMDNPVSLAIPQNVLVAKWNANNGVNWTQQKDAATQTAVMIYPDLGSCPRYRARPDQFRESSPALYSAR